MLRNLLIRFFRQDPDAAQNALLLVFGTWVILLAILVFGALALSPDMRKRFKKSMAEPFPPRAARQEPPKTSW